MEITTEPQTAIEGDNVTLTCWATRYLYTDLQWLDSSNKTVTSNVSSLQHSHYSISLSLHLHNVHQNSTSGYRCQAYKLNKSAELKTVSLSVAGKKEDMKTAFLHFLLMIFCLNMILISFLILFVAARERPWLSQNLTNQYVNSSSTLTLPCNALGIPRPNITWYRNSVPVEQGPGNLLQSHNY